MRDECSTLSHIFGISGLHKLPRSGIAEKFSLAQSLAPPRKTPDFVRFVIENAKIFAGFTSWNYTERNPSFEPKLEPETLSAVGASARNADWWLLKKRSTAGGACDVC